MLIKYIIISIIGSITNILPISYHTHIFIYNNIFNTNIFENPFIINSIYLSIPISFICIYANNLINTNKKKKIKSKIKIKSCNILLITSLLSTIIIYYIPIINKNIKSLPIYLFILSIILIISTNSKGTKKINDITTIDSIIFSLSHILNIIPTISPLCSNLFISKILNFNKTTTIKYSLITLIPTYIIRSIPIIEYLNLNTSYIPYYLLNTIISIIINIHIINYLKDIYYNNKLYKLSIYTFLLGIFILYWFR